MKISKNILRKIIREEVRTIMEATETAEWTKDKLSLIKKIKVKVDGKMHKYSIEKDSGKKKVAKFDVKHKDNPSYGLIEKYLIKGKTSYTGFFAGYVGQGMGWKSQEAKASREFDEEQNLKLLAMQFKKLQTIINRVW
tara:strand:- start:300 stop:713 length:414 start_codon:yes stop_codon:yes gene_type:complete